MKKLWLVMLLGVLCQAPAASAQAEKADAHREGNFLFEVKVIDEFIERFNDDSASSLRKEYRRAKRAVPFNRPELIRSLFNRPVKADDPGTKAFVEQVVNKDKPQFLEFNDSNWYAEVGCAFTMNGQIVRVPLIMQVSTGSDKSAKWMIAGIGDSHIFRSETIQPAAPKKAEDKKMRKFISPSDYATNFLEFHRILSSGMDADNYFMPELLATDRGKKLVQLIKSNKLKFVHTEQMKFYFFQIPNYVFTVERFIRQTTHSGWLISDLAVAGAEEKKARIGKLLQRSL